MAQLWEDPVWDNLDRRLGQLFMVGFNGTTVTPQIRDLIEKDYAGSVLLTARNFESAEQATNLTRELQKIAYDSGHIVPLIIATDQENGGVNSVFDDIYIRQFPSAMGIAATGSTEIAYEVAKATAEELAACGINLITGPCLDTLSNAKSQALGVRAFGDDPHLVSSYATQTLKGFKEAGLATMGKHFPSYGNLDIGTGLDVPKMVDSLDQMGLGPLIPYRNAIKKGLDSIMVGGVAMSSSNFEVVHACLDFKVVQDLLRTNLEFDGVVISECLEMEALTQNVGVGGGTVMALKAGCDILLLCQSLAMQKEGISGLKIGLENDPSTEESIRTALRRVLDMKAKTLSWGKALHPAGVNHLSTLQPTHTILSRKAYNASVTVVRDRQKLLPLSNLLEAEEELLLLTPLIKPLAASASAKALSGTGAHRSDLGHSIMIGEQVFQELGKSLARVRAGRVLHTSYTSTGVRPTHEDLISKAGAVIIVTADGGRNLYQTSFARHIALLCSQQNSPNGGQTGKPVIAVAVSTPYDFVVDNTFGTYICTYDFTETSLNALVGVLCGEVTPAGQLPSSASHNQKVQNSQGHWLVESFNEDRDFESLDRLIAAVVEDSPLNTKSELAGATHNSFLLRVNHVNEAHFVVRNSSTGELFGFCSTYYFSTTETGTIGTIIVAPSRRKRSIGKSLHDRAIRALLQHSGIKRFQIGSRLPSTYLGIPSGRGMETKNLRSWFANLGWSSAIGRPVCSMILPNLQEWEAPNGMAKSLHSATVEFDLVYGPEHAQHVLSHVKTNSRQGLLEVYKLALQDKDACGIIRAKRPTDGIVIGTTVLYNQGSRLAERIPIIKDVKEVAGGISSPIISPSVGEYSTILQSLILLGVRQIKKQGCAACILDYIDGDGRENFLNTMGFQVLHNFEEVSCDAATSEWLQGPQ